MNIAMFFVPDINECTFDPCVNGGNCTNDIGTFLCTCPDRFTGTMCETGMCSNYMALYSITINTTFDDGKYGIVVVRQSEF